MLRILILFLLLLAGIVLGPMLAGHQGYVLIQTDHWNIETSVTGLVIILIVALMIILAVEWLLRRIFRTGKRTRGWFTGRKRRRAQRQTRDALIKLAEGDHKQVEKLLSRDADHAADPLANYLLAAEAAQQRGDEIRANQHLERAAEVSTNNQIPVEITRARILLARGEDHAARHCIDRLLDVAPRHPEVLRLAEQAYLKTGAWRALLDILPAMEKERLITEDQHQTLQQQAWLGMMNQAMAEQGSEGLKEWWKNQNRKTRQDTALQVAMADHLIECNDADTAQEIVLAGLKRQYDERLILLLPRINSRSPEVLEKALRQQIKQHGATPLLNSTLGQMQMRQGEWKSASEAFRQALESRPDTFDYAWLADCYDKLHRPEEAAKMRREGLLLTLKKHPDQ